MIVNSCYVVVVVLSGGGVCLCVCVCVCVCFPSRGYDCLNILIAYV